VISFHTVFINLAPNTANHADRDKAQRSIIQNGTPIFVVASTKPAHEAFTAS
jgi:hypothetical protein